MATWLCICALSLLAPSDKDRAEYEALKRDTPRDAASQIELALWCEQKGLATERTKHLAMALFADPDNTLARSLSGLVKDGDSWRRPEEPPNASPERLALLAEYEAKRLTLAGSVSAHAKLAQWCEGHALQEQAEAHWRAAVRIDPQFSAGWKKLGCQQVNGRWLTEAQVEAEKVEAETQKQATIGWTAKLTELKRLLRDPARREEAERALADVSDPRVVPAVFRVFLTAKDAEPVRAAQVLGQVDSARASKLLALLAVWSDSATARAQASATLRSRDPREFARELIEQLNQPIRYEVRPVGGPGAPGVLFVEGQEVNVRRTYSPPPVLTDARGAGQWVPGPDGIPIFLTANEVRTLQRDPGSHLAFQPDLNVAVETASRLSALSGLSGTGLGIDALATNPLVAWDLAQQSAGRRAASVLETARQRTQVMVRESVLTAQVAQAQLAADVAALDRENARAREVNTRVLAILGPFVGTELGADRERWRSWYQDSIGYRYDPAPSPDPNQPRPTIDQPVPIAYQPPSLPGLPYSPRSGYTTSSSCFAAGTLVHTRAGLRPIEGLRVGDMVLSQDVATGSMTYRPVTGALHNPPAETLRIKAGEETIVATKIHRFWRAGKGWALARDLEPGDMIRTVRGTAIIESIEPGVVVPVFNLIVADTGTFFVGEDGWLVRDNSLPDPRARPYDAPPARTTIALKSD